MNCTKILFKYNNKKFFIWCKDIININNNDNSINYIKLYININIEKIKIINIINYDYIAKHSSEQYNVPYYDNDNDDDDIIYDNFFNISDVKKTKIEYTIFINNNIYFKYIWYNGYIGSKILAIEHIKKVIYSKKFDISINIKTFTYYKKYEILFNESFNKEYEIHKIINNQNISEESLLTKQNENKFISDDIKQKKLIIKQKLRRKKIII